MKFDLKTVSSNSIRLHTLIMHIIYVTYINFRSTNFQILNSILFVIAQMFCMLQLTIQHLVKNGIEDEPKYTGNASVYFVTDYVCIF